MSHDHSESGRAQRPLEQPREKGHRVPPGARLDASGKSIPLVYPRVEVEGWTLRLFNREWVFRRGANDNLAVVQPKRALALLDLASLLAPKRVREEEIGDALEDIHRRLSQGQPAWKIYLRVASTLFWVAINSLREITGALLGRSKAGTGS